MQYTAGTHRIAAWSPITNAHIFPGPAVVTSLKSAAATALNTYSHSRSTHITGGAHTTSPDYYPSNTTADSTSAPSVSRPDYLEYIPESPSDHSARKASVVSVSTTISASREYLSPQPGQHSDAAALSPTALNDLHQPLARSLLLLAQMSSAGNLFTPAYTAECLRQAREHRDFVMGFIAQEGLNADPADNFITMTPGVSLPPPGREGDKMGDSKGQQYNTPRFVVVDKGVDVVIVGRGIVNASDRPAEAERYRREAWAAYEERIAARS